MQLETRIKQAIRDIPDYPKPGVIFKDIAPMLGSPALVNEMLIAQVEHWKSYNVQAVAAIEARGFIFGALIANALQVPFVPVRKSGKLPFKTESNDYSLEYGKATIEIHVDAFEKGCNVLIHDDLLATGGTAIATGELVERLGGRIAGFSFLINLGFLPGKTKIKEQFGISPFYLAEY
jgi:adenine phosphoribosyltransferase